MLDSSQTQPVENQLTFVMLILFLFRTVEECRCSRNLVKHIHLCLKMELVLNNFFNSLPDHQCPVLDILFYLGNETYFIGT